MPCAQIYKHARHLAAHCGKIPGPLSKWLCTHFLRAYYFRYILCHFITQGFISYHRAHASFIGYECAKPQGAFYLFVKAPGGDAKAFAEKAKAKNLLIVPSDGFGVPGYFRLSYCVSREMIERSLPVFKEVFESD